MHRLSYVRIHHWLGYLVLGLLLPLVFGIAFDSLIIFFSLLGVAATGLSYFSYRQARQVARNRPIYLVPGEQSRVKARFFRSRGNSNSEIFAWVFLGSSLAILATFSFFLMWVVNLQSLVFLIILILVFTIIFGFSLACSLDSKFSKLRPRLDPNENCPMKRMDPEAVKSYLREPEKQIAWKIGSIEIEGWYSPKNPSPIHLRIYDLPIPNYYGRYKSCPTCQETIAYIANSQIIEEPTKKSEGTRLLTYKCRYCDYQDEERKRIPSKGGKGSG